jgi:pimeloyl-ACP methyl ester carboxylesterase
MDDSAEPVSPAVEQQTVIGAGGLPIAVYERNRGAAQTVLLVHGYPDNHSVWDPVAEILAERFHVVTYDVRGAGASGVPDGTRGYRLDRLTDDLRALIDDLGPEPADVVAHDWGGVVAWWGALRFPARFARLAILNAPHPRAMRRLLRHDKEQRRRSRYLFYFQLPYLPERKIRAGDFRGFRAIFKRSSRPGTFTPEELAVYAEAAARPGALTAMLNWYRSALWCRPGRLESRIVQPPVRILWGEDDVALCPALAELSAGSCRCAELVRIPGAGHWVQHEAAGRIDDLLLDFLA